MELEGVATIGDGYRSHPVDVFFDVADGRCLIAGKGSVDGTLLGISLATKDDIYLENVRLQAGSSKFLAENLGPFFLLSRNQAIPTADDGISSSGLATALEINPRNDGVDEIELRPFSSKLELQIGKPSMDKGSEIFFHCDPRVRLECTVELGGEPVQVHSFRRGAPT